MVDRKFAEIFQRLISQACFFLLGIKEDGVIWLNVRPVFLVTST